MALDCAAGIASTESLSVGNASSTAGISRYGLSGMSLWGEVEPRPEKRHVAEMITKRYINRRRNGLFLFIELQSYGKIRYHGTLSVEKAAGKPSESVNASVAQEWPPAAHILRAFHIYFHNGRLSFVGRGAVEKFALRTCHEA